MPPTRLHSGLWTCAATAALCGAAGVLAFAPFGWWPLAPLVLAVLFGLWRGTSPRQAFVIGWAFGIGLFAFGLFWVRISIADYGGAPALLALSAAFSLAAFMALFHGLAGAVAVWLSPHDGWRRTALAAPAAWTGAEWVREWVFTGFPWLQIGYSQIEGPLAALAPLGGVLGVTLGTVLAAGWTAALFGKSSPRLLAAALAALLLGSLLLRDYHWTRPDGAPLNAALLQGNIPQEEKWLAGNLYPTMEAYLALTRDHAEADLILWPEAAIPALAHEVEEILLEPLQQYARTQEITIVLGMLFREGAEGPDASYYTSLLALNDGRDRYDKRHLVPFGEYFPLGFLWKDALRGLAAIGEDFTPGESAKPLIHAGQWRLGASICYEILFGEEVREALPEAQLLVNVSNDGWFGDSLGPHQHLEIARMRALENGRPLLRATNTGITAVIDPLGQVTQQLPQFERGALTAAVQPHTGLTPYARWGQWPVLALALSIGLWLRLRKPLAGSG